MGADDDVLTAEVEAALADVAGVAAVAVELVAEPVPSLVAFVVGGADERALRAQLRSGVVEVSIAVVFAHVEALPRQVDGTCDRPALRARARELARTGGAARTATEAAVTAVWQEALGTSGVGIDDDFFVAGGHSLLAAQLGARLSTLFGVSVPLSLLFDAPTIAEQAAWIDRVRTPDRAIERLAARGAMPLSFTQERMWFFDELVPGTGVNHMQRAFRLDGPLRRDALERALVAVAARHESFRTTFSRDGGRPTQRVQPQVVRCHGEEDLRSLGAAAADQARAGALDDAQRPFDLVAGPLWRTWLYRIDDDAHVLVMTIHHLVADAWSLNVWTQEVAAHYRAYLEGRDPIVEALPLQPADVAAWERRLAATGGLDRQRDYWRRTLAGLPVGIELPVDHPRPERRSHRGRSVPFTIDAASAERLRAVGQRRGCTTFMTLLAALDVVLARLSGQDDLCVGTPVASRDRPETRRLIGVFLHNLPIRVDASGDPTFEALLDRVRDATRGALANTAPYEDIVAGVGAPHLAGRHPLFNVMLNLVPPSESLALVGLTATPLPRRGEAMNLDLLVKVVERADGSLAGVVRSADDLFDEVTASRLARRLERVIAAAAAAPQTPLSQLPLLDPDERETVLFAWNRTDVGVLPATAHALFEARARARPAALALDDTVRRLSYGETDAAANRIAHGLLRRGLTPGTRVGVYLARSTTLAVAVLGVLKAGGAFVLLDAAVPRARLAPMIADAAPRWILSQRGLAAWLGETSRAEVILLDDDASLDGCATDAPRVEVGGGDLAYVLYTSGSTGRPKGVAVSHRALASRLEWVRRTFPFAPDEVCCQKTSVGFVDTIWELLAPLREGIPCILPPDEVSRDPAALAAVLERHGVTRMMLVPSLLRALLRVHRDRAGWLPRLTLWLVGGEELRPELARDFLAARPDARLVNLFGLSEVGGEATWHEVHAARDPRVPIGVPGPNTRAYVVDRHLQPAPIGVWGELLIGGAGVADGYLGRPEATHARFLADPACPGERCYRTGDRARWRADGSLEYAGRLDTQLKIRGVRIDPSEIEDALGRHPDVAAAVVVAWLAPDGEHRLVAYVTGEERPAPAAAALRRFLRASLPEPLIPTMFIPLASLPLAPSGKVDREALPAPTVTALAAEDAGRPASATEAVVAALWEGALGGGPIGPSEDFFARGGYSLLVAQLAAELSRAFGLEVPLAALFEATTIEAQAAWLDEARGRGTPWPLLVRVPRAPRMSLSFAQERMWFAEALGADASLLSLGLRLRGAVDVARLEHAIDAVAARHEALRTTFSAEGGVPYQTVHATLPRHHERLDLAALTAEERTAALARAAGDERARGFDLAAGPPWRTRLLRCGPDEHVLLLTMHHLVSDGWSMRRWLDEVSAGYVAPDARLPDLDVQPADVAAWQRACVDRGALDGARAYWRQALGGTGVRQELPADGPRQPGGAWVGADLAPAQVEALRRLARSADSTLFMVFLAALDLLLAELTGDDDVIVGAVVAGRDRPQVRPLIGVFLNMLPLRVNVGGATTLREALPRAREATRGALAHGEVPFERIVADVNPPRQSGRNPLFDVVLNFLPPAMSPVLGDMAVEVLTPPALVATPFDVMWRVIERGSGLQLRLEYRRRRFAAERAQAWLDRLLAILAPADA